jgi:hypothetical protein
MKAQTGWPRAWKDENPAGHLGAWWMQVHSATARNTLLRTSSVVIHVTHVSVFKGFSPHVTTRQNSHKKITLQWTTTATEHQYSLTDHDKLHKAGSSSGATSHSAWQFLSPQSNVMVHSIPSWTPPPPLQSLPQCLVRTRLNSKRCYATSSIQHRTSDCTQLHSVKIHKSSKGLITSSLVQAIDSPQAWPAAIDQHLVKTWWKTILSCAYQRMVQPIHQ